MEIILLPNPRAQIDKYIFACRCETSSLDKFRNYRMCKCLDTLCYGYVLRFGRELSHDNPVVFITLIHQENQTDRLFTCLLLHCLPHTPQAC